MSMLAPPDPTAPPPTLQAPVEPDNCIKILLATDNHIGYAENDPVRGRDSINTFREILQLAVTNDVDMLLLAGDLFHENRPSRTALYQTLAALREFTMGPRPVSIELVSDEGIGIARDAKWPGVNYEDENINVGLPIFSIHGNHDDPQGTGAEGALCALDLLAASGLINYFGRLELPGTANDDEEALETGLRVKPVLLQKGGTKLALYGMGNIRDERFHFEMRHNRIKMFRPEEDPDSWFNILLVHQNRVPHGPKNFVSDDAFGEEADLVVWGHEHDCINKACAQIVTNKDYHIVQPGSSIATSLAKGEAIPKHVSLLKIQGKEFEMAPIRLLSVRPFVFDELNLLEAQDADEVDLSTKIKVNKFLKAKVNELIDRANAEWDQLHPDEPEENRMLPLIRLRVDHSGGPGEGLHFEIGNPQRFGQDFINRVANPRDIVQFHRRNAANRKAKVEIDQPDLEEDEGVAELREKTEKVKVSTLVHHFLQAQNLGVLPERAMQRAVEDYVEKGDKDALNNLLKTTLRHQRLMIGENYEPAKEGPEYDDMEVEMQKSKEAAEARLGKKLDKGKDKGKGKGKRRDSDEDDSMADDDDRAEDDDDAASVDSMASSAASSVVVKGKGKGKAKAPAKKPTATAAAKGKGKAAPAKKNTKKLMNSDSDNSDDSDEDDSDIEIVPTKKKAAPKKAAPATKKAAPAKKAPPKTTQVMTDSESDDSDAPKSKKKRK